MSGRLRQISNQVRGHTLIGNCYRPPDNICRLAELRHQCRQHLQVVWVTSSMQTTFAGCLGYVINADNICRLFGLRRQCRPHPRKKCMANAIHIPVLKNHSCLWKSVS